MSRRLFQKAIQYGQVVGCNGLLFDFFAKGFDVFGMETKVFDCERGRLLRVQLATKNVGAGCHTMAS